MFEAFGLKTGTVYVTGKYRSECFMKLQAEYPYKVAKGRKKQILEEKVYPEPIIIRRSR